MKTKIYIYDTEPGCSTWQAFLSWLEGDRYMAMADEEYPLGRFLGSWRSPEKALNKATKALFTKYGRRPERDLLFVREVEM